jgi:hypothetical protein
MYDDNGEIQTSSVYRILLSRSTSLTSEDEGKPVLLNAQIFIQLKFKNSR